MCWKSRKRWKIQESKNFDVVKMMLKNYIYIINKRNFNKNKRKYWKKIWMEFILDTKLNIFSVTNAKVFLIILQIKFIVIKTPKYFAFNSFKLFQKQNFTFSLNTSKISCIKLNDFHGPKYCSTAWVFCS